MGDKTMVTLTTTCPQANTDNVTQQGVDASSTAVSPAVSEQASLSAPNGGVDKISMIKRSANSMGQFIGNAIYGNIEGFGRSRIKTDSYKSPVLPAVITSRTTEIALTILKYVWKKPFASISDARLASIFAASVAGVSYFVIKSKHMRRTFANIIKYTLVIALFWVAIFTFIELLARKKTDYIKKVIELSVFFLFFSIQNVSEFVPLFIDCFALYFNFVFFFFMFLLIVSE